MNLKVLSNTQCIDSFLSSVSIVSSIKFWHSPANLLCSSALYLREMFHGKLLSYITFGLQLLEIRIFGSSDELLSMCEGREGLSSLRMLYSYTCMCFSCEQLVDIESHDNAALLSPSRLTTCVDASWR